MLNNGVAAAQLAADSVVSAAKNTVKGTMRTAHTVVETAQSVAGVATNAILSPVKYVGGAVSDRISQIIYPQPVGLDQTIYNSVPSTYIYNSAGYKVPPNNQYSMLRHLNEEPDLLTAASNVAEETVRSEIPAGEIAKVVEAGLEEAGTN